MLIIAVGGGAKVYNGDEAARVIKDLKPKQIIPVQYVRGTSPTSCDQTGIEPFLEAMKGVQVRDVGESFTLPSNLSGEMVINLMP